MSTGTATHRSTVVITSVLTGESWRGDVDTGLPEDAPVEHKLERLFRLFNRVDEEDVTRLEMIGYRQPSMSCGDTIDLDGQTWKVSACGFERT